MRYPASETFEIIRIVEQSHLPARRTLRTLGIPRATFHRWYDRFLAGGVEALDDRRPRPGVNRQRTLPPDWSAPLGVDIDQAAVLPIFRMC